MKKKFETLNEFQTNSIKELAHKNNTSNSIFTYLSKRKRYRMDLDLIRLKIRLIQDLGNIDKVDFDNVFNELEKLGIGKIAYGKDSTPLRFVWNYNLKEVGKASGIKVKELRPNRRKHDVAIENEEVTEKPSKEEKSETNVTFIKGDVKVEMRFPDSTKAIEFIRKLAS